MFRVVAPFSPHPGSAHLIDTSLANRLFAFTAAHPSRAICGTLVTESRLGRADLRFGWGVAHNSRTLESFKRTTHRKTCKRCQKIAQ